MDWRDKRLPFLVPAASAAIGSLAGAMPDVAAPGLVVAAACLLAAAWVRAGGRGGLLALAAAIACTVAARHVWLAREAPAARLAAALPGPLVVDARLVVAGEPREFAEGRSAFTAQIERLHVAGRTTAPAIPVAVEWKGPTPSTGDVVELTATWRTVPGPRNPSAFDRAAWLARAGIHSELVVADDRDGRVVRPGPVWGLRRIAGACRRWLEGALTAGLDPASQQARVIVAMTLGQAGPVDREVVRQFRDTGTLHLFSVSGLHVAMLGSLLWMMLRGLSVPRQTAAALLIPALFFYALVTGWQAPGVRAATMASFVLVGLVVGRPSVVANSLLAAAFFILVADPRQLFHPGFQLSFAVVFALLVAVPCCTRWLQRPFAIDPFLPRRLATPVEVVRERAGFATASMAAISIVAWLGSMPLVAGLFGLVPLVSVPANMASVPLAFLSMALAVLAVVAAPFSLWLAGLYNNANLLVTSLLLATVHAFASLPGASVRLPGPPARLTILDMGAGAAVLLERHGEAWLIDCGPQREFDRTVAPVLRARGITQLAGLVLTHGDTAHLGGALDVVTAFRPARIVTSPAEDRSPLRKALFQTLNDRGIPKTALMAGDTLGLPGGGHIEVLHPPAGIQSEYADDKSLVLALDIEGWRVLVLSDSGPSTYARLLAQRPEALPCDVIILGAHRGGLPPPAAFLSLARPQLAVVAHSPDSTGPVTAPTISNHHATVWPQSRHGAVTLTFSPNQLTAEGFVSRQTARWPRTSKP